MGYNPSRFKDPERPVETVSFDEALSFCQKLTEIEQAAGTLPTGFHYALPTTEMWRRFVANARLEDAVTGRRMIRRSTEKVGTLGANRLGLYDVRGNVWEYCSDWYDAQRKWHAIRGGAFNSRNPKEWSIDWRGGTVGPRSADTGFRAVLAREQTS